MTPGSLAGGPGIERLNMTLTIKIKMDSAAFEPDKTGEVVRILQRLIENTIGDWPGENAWAVGLRDINGNRVGEAKVTQ